MNSRLPAFVLLGVAGLGFSPGPSGDNTLPPPIVAERDPGFELPDSVTLLLSDVTDLVLADDGTLFLSDGHLPAVLQLDSTGTLRRQIGRKGSGPGEFSRGIPILGLRGDSLWALDLTLRRITLFPLQGEGVGTLDFRGLAGVSTGRPMVRWGIPQALLSDGSLLVLESEAEPGAVENPGTLMYRTNRRLEILDTLARLGGRRSGLEIPVGDGQLSAPQPFSDEPRGGASEDGSLLVLIERSAADRPGTAQFRITARRPGGATVFDRAIDYQPRPITDAEVDSVVRQISHGVPGARMPPIPEGAVRRLLFRPAFWPPVSNLLVGRDGTIWVALTSAEGPANVTDWLVLSPRGLPVGRVQTPAGFRLMEENRGVLYGVEGGWGEVPVLTRYRVPKRGV